MNIAEIAAQLVEARQSGIQALPEWPDPAPTMDDAMQIQGEAFKQLASPSIGWKVGAANRPSQQAFGIDAPFFGPMAQAGVLDNNSSLKKTACVGACEPEYAFKMARDFPSNGEEINAANATNAVGFVHAAIEVIGRCIGSPDFANGLGVTMDFGGNVAFVIGPEVADWKNQDLANSPVLSKVDGEVVQTGSGQLVMDDPINSLVWIAQTLANKGMTLKAGDWVSSGTCTTPVPAVAGSTYTATFGEFGDVSISFA